MNSETSSSRVSSGESRWWTWSVAKNSRGAAPSLSMEGWMDVPDPNYGAFDLVKTGVPQLRLAYVDFLLFQKYFVQFFHLIWLTLLFIFTITMVPRSIDPHQAEYAGRVFTVEGIYEIRAHIQEQQYHNGKGLGRRPFVALWRKGIVPFFGEKKRILRACLWTIECSFLVAEQLRQGHVVFTLGIDIAGGELRALDEKMYKWRGKSPCIREIRSITTLRSKLLAFLYVLEIGMYPIDKYTTLSARNNICDVFKWAAELPCCSQICTLCWFLLPRQCVTTILDEWRAANLVLHQKRSFQDRLQEKVRQPGESYAYITNRQGRWSTTT